MALSTYSTGTVSVSEGGTTVTGVGTIWSGNKAVAGDDFVIGGVRALIVNVVSVTELTITPWLGSDETGAAYAIYQTSSQRFDDVDLAVNLGKVADVWTSDGFYIYVPSDETDPDPSLGNDGQFAFQAATGKLWVKESGIWSFLGIYKGFSFKGAYDSETAYTVNDVITSDGNAYIVTAATTGNAPPNASYYSLLVSKGTTGSTGATGATPLKPIEAWATATAYVVGPPASFVSQAGSSYECLVAHTSGASFNTDLAAGKWGIIAGKGTDGTGTGDVVGPAGATDGGLVVFDGTDGKHVKALDDADAALTELGATTIGKTVFTSASAPALRTAIGLFGFVTAAQYGVTGDGSTDDAAALQDFFDALEASPYLAGWLIGSSGVFFSIDSTVSIGNNVKVMGCGWNSEIRPTFNGAALKTKGTSTVGVGGIFLSDFSIVGKTATITGISKANPAVVTCSGGHPFVNGETVRLPNVRGMTEVAGTTYTVANRTATTFELSGVNSSSYTTYTAGGDVVYSASIGFDERYSSGNRFKNINTKGVQNAYFKYTDSGTVGCYYNVLEDCQASSCEIGDYNYIGANSNNTRGLRTSNVRFPVIDQGNANNCDVHSAEVFETVITANSGSAGSRFNVLRAENPTSTGLVYSIGLGVTDAIIVARPYRSSVAGLLSDSGTRTVYGDDAGAKAWGTVTQSGGTYTLGNNYNVASISKASTGIITVTLKSAMPSTDYVVSANLTQAAAGTIQEAGSNRTTTTIDLRIQSVGSTPAAMDSGFSFTIHGRQ